MCARKSSVRRWRGERMRSDTSLQSGVWLLCASVKWLARVHVEGGG